MAKGQIVTGQEIAAVVETIEIATTKLADMQKRINNGHLGSVPDAYQVARALVCASRSINDFALRMFDAHDITLDKPKAI